MENFDDDKVLLALCGAHALVSDPRTWCRFALARDDLGFSASPQSATAVAWCGIGALVRASAGDLALVNACLSHLEAANPFGVPVRVVNDCEFLGRDALAAIFETAIGRFHRSTTTPRRHQSAPPRATVRALPPVAVMR